MIKIGKEFLLIEEANFIELVPLAKYLKKEEFNRDENSIFELKNSQKDQVIFNASNLGEVCKDQRKLIE